MSHHTMVDELMRLCALPAPTGGERVVVDLLAKRWAGSTRDGVGNLLVKIGGEGRRTLVHAHADQVGYVINAVTDDGFLLLDTAQGLRGPTPERRWPVGTGALVGTRNGIWIDGVFAAASGHVTRWEPVETGALTWDNFWVDAGFECREDVLAAGVHIGAPVIYEPRFRQLGRDRVACAAIDDRVALYIMETLRRVVGDGAALTCELWLAVTVHEEGGMLGAHALGASERFDRVVGLEVGLVGDVPGVDALHYPGRLGAGPMIVHKDSSMTYDRDVTQLLVDAARRSGVDHQDAVFAGYSTDGVGFLKSGSPAGLLAVPTRYTHTPFETIDLRDVTATVKLLRALVS